MPHPTALFALSLIQRQVHLQISRVRNIGNVFNLSGVVFRIGAPYGGLLVKIYVLLYSCFYPMSSGQLRCPNIDSYDFVNKVQLKTINSFIIAHKLSPRLNTIFSG